MVMEIENDNLELSGKFEKIILKMEADISADLVQLNLLEHEEKTLLGHVMWAIKESSSIFESSMEKNVNIRIS